VVRIFLAIQKNKKVKTLQKLSNEVQKKNKTEKSVLSCRKHRMCTQEIRKTKYTQKINRITECWNTQYFVLDK